MGGPLFGQRPYGGPMLSCNIFIACRDLVTGGLTYAGIRTLPFYLLTIVSELLSTIVEESNVKLGAIPGSIRVCPMNKARVLRRLDCFAQRFSIQYRSYLFSFFFLSFFLFWPPSGRLRAIWIRHCLFLPSLHIYLQSYTLSRHIYLYARRISRKACTNDFFLFLWVCTFLHQHLTNLPG